MKLSVSSPFRTTQGPRMLPPCSSFISAHNPHNGYQRDREHMEVAHQLLRAVALGKITKWSWGCLDFLLEKAREGRVFSGGFRKKDERQQQNS